MCSDGKGQGKMSKVQFLGEGTGRICAMPQEFSLMPESRQQEVRMALPYDMQLGDEIKIKTRPSGIWVYSRAKQCQEESPPLLAGRNQGKWCKDSL